MGELKGDYQALSQCDNLNLAWMQMSPISLKCWEQSKVAFLIHKPTLNTIVPERSNLELSGNFVNLLID